MANITCGLSVGQIAGISVGVIVGIVLGSILVIALVVFLSKRGYDAYMAQSALNSAGAHTSPAYRDNDMAGTNVAYSPLWRCCKHCFSRFRLELFTAMWVSLGLLAVVLLALPAHGQDPSHYCFGDPAFVNNARPGYALRQVLIELQWGAGCWLPLHQVNTVTRHGDRTPIDPLPQLLENVAWQCTMDMVQAGVDGENASVPTRQWRKQYINKRQSLPGSFMGAVLLRWIWWAT
jgi:hypothetical protein